MARRNRSGMWLGVVLAAAALNACGGSDDKGAAAASAPADTGPIKVAAVVDKTGPAGFAGGANLAGFQYAVDEANKKGELGKRKIEVTVLDTASLQPQAVAAMSKAVASDAVASMFGALGQEALAIGPIAQRGKLSMLVTESGVPGVLSPGDYIFRVTPPQDGYTALQAKYFQSQGVKTVSMIYQSDNATLADLAKRLYPTLAKQYGFQIVDSTAFTANDTDFAGIVSKSLKKSPDAVIELGIGTANPSLITQLRRAGFKGHIGGQVGLSGTLLKSLGKLADGITYPANFTPETTDPAGKDFVANFTQATGSPPILYNADGYDAGRLMIEGLKRAKGKLTRESVQAGILAASQAGIDSASGQIHFDARDARVGGSLIRWEDGKEVPILSGG